MREEDAKEVNSHKEKNGERNKEESTWKRQTSYVHVQESPVSVLSPVLNSTTPD